MFVRAVRRIVGLAVVGLLAGTTLTGCHGGPHATALITGVDWPTSFFVTPDNNAIWYSLRFSGEIHRRNLSNGNDTLVFTVTNVLSGTEQGLFGLAPAPELPLVALPLRLRHPPGRGRGRATRCSRSRSRTASASPARSSSNPPQPTSTTADASSSGPTACSTSSSVRTPSRPTPRTSAPRTRRARSTASRPTARCRPTTPSRATPSGPTASATPSGSASTPRTASSGPPTTGPSATTRSTASPRAATTRGGPTPPARGTAPDNTNQDGPLPQRKPKHFYATPIGITGLAFCSSCGLGSAVEGTLLVGAANNGHIRRLTLDAGRANVVSDNLLYDHTSGRLLGRDPAGPARLLQRPERHLPPEPLNGDGRPRR